MLTFAYISIAGLLLGYAAGRVISVLFGSITLMGAALIGDGVVLGLSGIFLGVVLLCVLQMTFLIGSLARTFARQTVEDERFDRALDRV